MRHYSGVMLLLVAFGTCAQKNTVTITFCPLAALDGISFPTIQAGLEYKPAGHFSLYNEFGVEYKPGGVDRTDTVILRPHGIKAKTELRYYLGPENYLAFNGFVTSDAHNTGAAYYDTLNPSTLRTASFGVHKNVWGWNILWGWKESLGGRFWLEGYVGVGVRYRYVRTVGDQLNSSDLVPLSIDPNIASMKIRTEMTDGWSTAPNFTVGVRLLYRFGRIVRDERPPRRVKPPVLGSPVSDFIHPHPPRM